LRKSESYAFPLAGELNPFYGKKHTETFKKYLSDSRKGELNPMFGLPKSTEFSFYATRDRSGANNPRAKQTTLTNVLNGVLFLTLLKSVDNF
jgi:hypothetical protein